MNNWDRFATIPPVLLGSIMGANVLTMSWMNFFEVQTRYIVVVYPAFLLVVAILMLRSGVSFPAVTKREHLFCAILALLIFLPRVPYILEGLLGYAVNPLGDDPFHIPNMASIIHSDSFPPRSTYDRSEYLAYYYAPWIPGAAIYYAGFASTVKQAIGLLKLLYSFLIAYFPVCAAKVLFPDRNLRTTFLILCFLYGGFDFLYWLSSMQLTPVHSEWWAEDFGFLIQFSSFVTLALWTPQHFLAGATLLLGLYVVSGSRKAIGHALFGLFALTALFSSPFVTFGAIPIVIWYLFAFGKLRAVPVAAVTFIVLSLPLWWILLGNDSVGFESFGALEVQMWRENKRAAFGVFLLVLTLELGPLLAGAAYFVKQNRIFRWLFACSAGYLLSTFFCFFSENYSMRGSVVPILALTYLSTPSIYAAYEHLRHCGWRIAMASYLLGGILEYASFARAAWISFEQSNTEFNAKALISNFGPEKFVSNELNSEAAYYPFGWEVLEKNRATRRDPMRVDQARQMHPDNHYRLSISKLRVLLDHLAH